LVSNCKAAANEEAIVISLGLQHSFPWRMSFEYSTPIRFRRFSQAILDQPMFESAGAGIQSIADARPVQNGKAVPPQIMRMRATDLLAALSRRRCVPGKHARRRLPIPMITHSFCQTMKIGGPDGKPPISALDSLVLLTLPCATAPSSGGRRYCRTLPFARGILSSELYTFLATPRWKSDAHSRDEAKKSRRRSLDSIVL